MSKGAIAISIIALIAAAGGIGFGYFAMTQQVNSSEVATLSLIPELFEQQGSGIKNTWYMLNRTQAYSDHIGPDDLVINFNVGPGESVYFHISGNVCMDPLTPGIVALLTIEIKIDGILIAAPNLCLKQFNFSFVSMDLQNLTSYISPGSHNISVFYIKSNLDPISSYLYYRSLLVQTLIP